MMDLDHITMSFFGNRRKHRMFFGALHIYKKDKHIFDAISKNPTIKRVYISLCSKEKYLDTREKADTFL